MSRSHISIDGSIEPTAIKFPATKKGQAEACESATIKHGNI